MKVTIFDIDGTLANCGHRQHHMTGPKKDWDAFYAAMDSAIPHATIACLAEMCRNWGWPVILCSGRPMKYRAITIAWMARHGIRFHELYMRADGDFRDDVIVKREMLTLIRAVGFEPQLVVDDRTKVVNMWREEGLTCLQCAPGDF